MGLGPWGHPTPDVWLEKCSSAKGYGSQTLPLLPVLRVKTWWFRGFPRAKAPGPRPMLNMYTSSTQCVSNSLSLTRISCLAYKNGYAHRQVQYNHPTLSSNLNQIPLQLRLKFTKLNIRREGRPQGPNPKAQGPLFYFVEDRKTLYLHSRINSRGI